MTRYEITKRRYTQLLKILSPHGIIDGRTTTLRIYDIRHNIRNYLAFFDKRIEKKPTEK